MEKAPFAKMEKAPFRPQSRRGGGPKKFATFQKGAFCGAPAPMRAACAWDQERLRRRH
jgi:hypothetical protein